MDRIFPGLAPRELDYASALRPAARLVTPPLRAPLAATSVHVSEPTRSINQGNGFFCAACGLRMKKHGVYLDSDGERHYECPEN